MTTNLTSSFSYRLKRIKKKWKLTYKNAFASWKKTFLDAHICGKNLF